jgi:hypothetical protein
LRDLQNEQRNGQRQFIEQLPARVEERATRLNGINEAFQQQQGTNYNAYLGQQRANALQLEQSLSAPARERLDATRNATYERIKALSEELQPAARQIAATEAPLRAALNPQLADPANWSRLAPTIPPGSPAQGSSTVPAGPGGTFTPPQTTFAPLTREMALRQQLAIEQQRARAIDTQNEILLVLEIPLRAGVVAGGAAASGLGMMAGGPAGAAAAGLAYRSITAAPDIYFGNRSPAAAAGGVGVGTAVDLTGRGVGVPQLGTVYSAASQTADWYHQMRVFQATRTPR